MNVELEKKCYFNESALHQAFSHLSRMHTSSYAAFFASLFPYTAYIGFVFAYLKDKAGLTIVDLVLLIVLPAIVPVFLGFKYGVTSFAFRKIARDIMVCKHSNFKPAHSGADPLNLYDYIWGNFNPYWVKITQPDWHGKRIRIFGCSLLFSLYP